MRVYLRSLFTIYGYWVHIMLLIVVNVLSIRPKHQKFQYNEPNRLYLYSKFYWNVAVIGISSTFYILLGDLTGIFTEK